MDDSISRQAAIDVLLLGKEILGHVLDDTDVVGTDREKYSWGLALIEASIKDIEELPSAQPEPCEDAVSREDVLEVNFLMPESELVFYDNDHGFCINTQDVLEHLEFKIGEKTYDI